MVFYLVVPWLLALWAASVGVGPSRGAPFEASLAYLLTQLSAAWWVNGLLAWVLAGLLRPAGLRGPVILVTGTLLSWAPLYFYYALHFDFFNSHFPDIRHPAERPEIQLTLEYVLYAARHSLIPFIPFWLGAIYGYRLLTGVDIFLGPAHPRSPGPRPAAASPGAIPAPAEWPPGSPVPDPVVPLATADTTTTTVGTDAPLPFLAGTRLAGAREVLAITAEEHYIRVWAPGGTDLIRYRFGDALKEAGHLEGGQVHRSWWVSWPAVTGWNNRGRTLELELRNGVTVPVSLAYKTAVLDRLRDRGPAS